MGALHRGHASLIGQSTGQNDVTIASIFVNPTQFNNADDFKKYPRTESADTDLLAKNKCDLAFIPTVEEVYAEDKLPDLDFGMLDKVMEGKFRPGHFSGVATVVHKLFSFVTPDRAYFGEKDFQQIVIVRNMVRLMNLAVEIIGCETIREKNGLAMSSRNIHLTSQEKKASSIIFETLIRAGERFRQEDAIENIIDDSKAMIDRTGHFSTEYFVIADETSFEEVNHWNKAVRARAFTAVKTSSTRLIDNMALYSSSRGNFHNFAGL